MTSMNGSDHSNMEKSAETTLSLTARSQASRGTIRSSTRIRSISRPVRFCVSRAFLRSSSESVPRAFK